ncbi:GNAT family N-acetyltransferase [uncultured Cohaesibacter sp.]|uniref:GNAT family N-acetyltransferase n=1 Tax=uncultured Cohaesibacter sp. TaxID=1002546 RepID=UPI00292FA9E0|nr:GNAT family N-acetyltransferase [uncultured Cohaesibacter sp.]
MSRRDLVEATLGEAEEARALLYAGFYDYARNAGREEPGPYETLEALILARNVYFWRGRTGIVVFDKGTREGRLMLALFCLHPDYHRSGLGADMMADAVCLATERGFSELELYTREIFAHLRRFYEGQGFILERTGPHLTKPDGNNRIFMVKPLRHDP